MNFKNRNLFKFLVLTILMFLISCTIVRADWDAKYNIKNLSLYASGGYRKDNLKWNIASDLSGNQLPHVASELKWDNLKIYQYKIGSIIPLVTLKQESSYVFPKVDSLNLDKQTIYLDLSMVRGDINDGKNQDSDYNQTGEYSRSNNDGSGGNVRDYEASLNYRLDLKVNNSAFAVTPSIGYGRYEQNLRISNGYQTISSGGSVPPVGPLSNIDSTYDTSWKGPFFGLAVSTIVSKKHSFEVNSKIHSLDYDADADWNIRNDLQHPKSFDHSASGNGFTFGFKYGYQIFTNTSVGFEALARKFKVSNGTATFYNSNGTTSAQRLNDAEWTSAALMVGLKYGF